MSAPLNTNEVHTDHDSYRDFDVHADYENMYWTGVPCKQWTSERSWKWTTVHLIR